MTKDLVVEVGSINDLGEAMEVAEEVFNPTLEEKQRYHQFTTWQERMEKGLLIVGRCGEKIVGFAISYPKETDFHVWNVGVLSDYRKMGLWQMMYKKTEEYAISKGYKTISLNTYKDDFPSMYNFCKNNGFVEVLTEKDEKSGKMKSCFEKEI